MNPSNILSALKDLAPALSGHPVAVWQTAREGTQRAADLLPDAMGLDQVKGLIRKHPSLAACAVLALGGYLSTRLVRSLPTSEATTGQAPVPGV